MEPTSVTKARGVGIERGPEAMDEGQRSEADVRGCAGTDGVEPILHAADCLIIGAQGIP